MMNSNQQKALSKNGYTVLRKLFPNEIIDGCLSDITKRMQYFNKTCPNELDAATDAGFFPMWNSSSLWRAREFQPLVEAFRTAIGTNDLWVSLDRCGYRYPQTGAKGRLELHWDDNRSRWDFAPFQGVLALTNSLRTAGGFIASPELFRIYRDFGKRKAKERAKSGLFHTENVDLMAGDFLIFDHRLAHGTDEHTGSDARIVQYIAYRRKGGPEEANWRKYCWESGTWWGKKKLQAYNEIDELKPKLSKLGKELLYG